MCQVELTPGAFDLKRQELTCHGFCLTPRQTRFKTTMNLSSYLQMPPAPLVSTHTNPTVPQAPGMAASPSAGAGLGFDFADVMARQLQRLVPQQRQSLAAEAPQPQPTPTSTPVQRSDQTRPHQENTATDQTRQSDRDQIDADAHALHEEDSRSSKRTASSRPLRDKKNDPSDSNDVDALLAGLMQGAPVAPTANSEIAATDTLAAAPNGELSQASSLQTIQLSSQVRIITDPKQAPSPESLVDFAKSMGLDESAIQNLLAQAPANVTTLASTPTTSGTTATGLPLNAMAMATDSGTGLATMLQTASDHPLAAASVPVTDLSLNPGTSAPISGAGLAAAATTLINPAAAGLTPTDMASIQQLQITVLPAAVLPIHVTSNSPTPSTLDMLSLLGTGVDAQDVSALLSRFSEGDSGGTGNDAQQGQGENQNFSSFAQALSNTKNTPNASTPHAAQATSAHMSEVYDQLSDKMATELAARMHKQLSDGEWKMKFGLRPANLGGVEIQLEMKDGKLDAIFRADNPLTRDLLQNSSQRLREALANFGINAGQVNVGQGGGHSQQNSAGYASKQAQVRDNSTSQVNGTGDATSATSSRSKANASLLDLYA